MKTLALGAIGLALALVLVGLSSGAIGIQLVTQLIAMASAGLFLLGLFPPRAVRVSWRREEEEDLRRAELKWGQSQLMEVMQPSEVPQALLPRVSRLLGGKGSVLIGADGEVVACDGVDRTGASNIADEVVRSGGGEIRAPGGTILSVPLRPGWLAVEASRFTPFFGRDETEMLRSIALLAELALNRAELSQKQLHMQAQLVQAQAVAQIGSWEWDLGTNEISWSPQLYEIFGEDPETFTPDYDTLASRSHPEDREAVQKEAAAAIERGSTFETEYRVIRSDGDVITLHSQGKPILDGSGKVVRMVGILQDVSERRRQEQAREQFIANAAHELRTPLTSLLGFVEVLSTRRQMMSEEDIDQSYKVMERAGRRLAKLVSNLLDLTKVQQGHIELELIPVPLGVTVSEIVRGNPVPDGKHVDLDIPSDVMVLADPSRLGQIVLNLLSNAYKYGGPAITVSAVKQREAVLLSVTDDGPGVEPLLIEMLFEPFRRGEEVTRISGSGLGLAIVKMLVDASGGAVHYESVEPSGARFVVSLRRA
jgi:PAS domain S-box-containing protein